VYVEGSFGVGATYLIPGVPEGGFVLCHDPPGAAHVCTDTASGAVDLGFDVTGRKDLARAELVTPLTFSLGGLEAWDPIWEEVQVTSSHADLWDVAAPGPALRGGATSGTVVKDWSRASAAGGRLHLLASSDVLFLHQLGTRSIYVNQGIAYYVAATRGATVAGAPMPDGQSISFSASLATLPLVGQVPVAWSPVRYEIHLPDLAPPARRSTGPSAHRLVVGVSPAALDRPGPSLGKGFPQLLRLELPAGAPRIDDTLYHGRFLPGPWTEWRGARFAVSVSYLAPGASVPLVEESVVERRDPVPAAASLDPAVGPPRSPKVNDLDAFADQASVGVTPTFSWLAPAVGSPTTYVVEVYRLGAEGAATVSTPVLRYFTKGTSITVPPRILEAGATYFARIEARVTLVAHDTAPLRTSDAGSVASALTGTFVP
jgi:hypothetical protein